MNIYQQLTDVQAGLHAPKSQKNKFGNYEYRSAEDILAAVKPLLKKHNLALTITDELKLIGDRYYVEASATVYTAEDSITDTRGFITVSAYAREDETKKGMDGSQITGAASSYARKYALNGLFAIDDTKDADSMDNRKQSTKQPASSSRPPEATDRKQHLADLLAALDIKNMQERTDFFVAATGREKPANAADIDKSAKYAEWLLGGSAEEMS